MAPRNDSFFKILEPVTTSHRGVLGIYCILNVKNGRFYVGSAVSLCGRKDVHLSNLKLEKHHSQFLQNDYNKCGAQSFKFYVLEFVKEKKLLLKIEQSYLDRITDRKNCYNCCYVAGSWYGNHHTEKTKEKLRQRHLGKKLSKEHRDKIGKSGIGKHVGLRHTIETKKLMSQKALGRKHNKKTREKMSESHKGKPTWNKGKKYTKEMKLKMSELVVGEKNPFYGKRHTNETKQKIREKLLGKCFKPTISVIATNIETKEILCFSSMAEASRSLGVRASHISSVCSGRLNQTGGWSFKKEIK